MASLLNIERINLNLQSSTINHSGIAPSQFKIFASQSLTPQNVRPVTEAQPAVGGTGNASRMAANTSLNLGYQQRNQLVSRNDTMHNSHIHGRKVDSPKIYVKDVNERPKTSAQQARKTPQGSQAANTSVMMKQKKPRDRYNEGKKLNQNFLLIAPHTNKDAENRKFDFKFVTTAKADSKDKSKKSGGKKKQNLNKSQVINFHGDKTGHHKTQTVNYELNLKTSQGPRASGGDKSQLPSSLINVLDSQVVSWNDMQKTKGQKNQSSNSNIKQRKRLQSLNMPKGNSDSATYIHDNQPINIQLPGSSKMQSAPKKPQFPNSKAIPTKPPVQDSFCKIRRKQHMHNQTMVIVKNSEYSSDVPKIPKTQRSQPGYINASSNSVMAAHERKKTKSGDRSTGHAGDDFKFASTKQSKGQASKSQRSKKEGGHNSHSGLHEMKNPACKRNNAHFSFDIATNKENVCSNSSQNINDKQNLSISSNSSGKNGQKNMQDLGKLFKNNFFVDGEQLLRHMSPGTPDKQRSIEATTDQNIIHVPRREGSNSRTKARPSTSKTSANRPQSKAMSGVQKPLSEDSVKKTLDNDQLHTHQRNKIQIFTGNDHDDSLSAQNRDSMLRKGFLSQQLSANNDANSNGSYRFHDKKEKVSGLDKLVKRNIKKKQRLNTEELIKKFMEETQKKQKKAEIYNRNQEVRKMNAKAPLNEQDRLQAMLNNMKYKKKRSKSCINKTDNIFQKVAKEFELQQKKAKRDKSNENNKTSVLSCMLDPLLSKKNQEVAGRNSAVVELTQLKKEIDNEIRRDRKEGKLQILSPSANPVQKKEVVKKVNKDLNVPKDQFKVYTSLRIVNQEVLFERNNKDQEVNIKQKIKQDENEKFFGSTGNVASIKNMNTSKIQKFIEKQKKRKAAKKSLEETQQHEKVMKVHQNLIDLHKFTVQDRKKNPKKQFFEKKTLNSNQQSQLLDHIRNHPILNLKVGKKRKTSIEHDSERLSNSKSRQIGKKIKIQPLRYRGRASVDNNTDMLEQTIQIDSSRMEGADPDNSIINLYRKLSGSRKSSNNSNIRSALRSETSPHPRSYSGGRQGEHPPLKVLKQTKLSSPGQRPRVHDQSTGSAHLRRKHQNQIENVVKNSRFFGKDSPELSKSLNKSMGKDAMVSVSPKAQNSISPPSKQKLTSEQFESLEPTRTAKQIKKNDQRVPSVISQASGFDRRVQEFQNKYGIPGDSEPQMLIRLHTAAVKIQYHMRKHLNRSKHQLPQIQQIHDLEIRKQATSEREKISSSRDGTGQSIRKSVIPTLDLEKLAQQKARTQAQQDQPYLAHPAIKDELEPPISTSRSIFARNTFRDFMDKMGVTSIEELNVNDFPEMMKLREKAISHRQRQEESKITTMYKQKQISPRTYDIKRKELEVWVDKEKEEVKKTKKIIEDEHQKTANLLNYSASNSDQIKRILKGSSANGNNNHNVSKGSQPTLTDRASSARLGGASRRGDGKSQLLAMIYQQTNGVKQEDVFAISDDNGSKRLIQSPVVEMNQTEHSPSNDYDDPLTQVLVVNPNAIKNFPMTAQKPEIKSFSQSNQKSSIQTSDNPESLRDSMFEQGLSKIRTPIELGTATERSLDIDGAVDPELEDQFNKHISQQLLGKLIQEEREKSYQSERESSAKPCKKNGDIAPTGPFKQRRQAFEAASNDKPLHRVTSQQQLQDNHDLELSSEENKQSDSSKGKKVQILLNKSKPKTLLRIPDDEDDLARKVMEVSPVSNQNTPINFSKDDLKSSIRSETFFLNNLSKINSGQATSFDDLQEFTSEQKDMIAHLQGAESYEIQGLITHSITTPLSEGNNDKIRIEISGQQLTNNNNDGFQPAMSFTNFNQIGAPVSPMSNDSMGGIKCGATSLSSNTSDEKAIPGMLQVIHEISDEHKSRIYDSGHRGELIDLQETNKSLQISLLDTTGPIDSSAKPSLLDSSQKMVEELGKNLSKELKESGEKLADEIYQLLLVELAIDLPVITNRNIQRSSDSGYHFKDQAHGIKTDLFAIERYVDEVQNEVMGNKKEFMDALGKPLSKDAIATLNMLQNSEIGSCEHFEENYPQILHLDLYLTLEKRRKEKREKQIQDMEELDSGAPKTQSQIHTSVLRTFLAECEHIHNKVLFDCINDSLIQFKPFSKEGQPLPWSRQNRRLKPSEDFTLNEIFEIVKHDLFRWAITQSGTLPRREMVYQGVFDQDLFDEIREKKLVHMLCCEMVENEPKWLNYEFEHAQVKIDVGDMILEQLVNETIALMNQNATRDLTDSLPAMLDNSKSHNIDDSWPSSN